MGNACCAFPLRGNLCQPYWGGWKENWFRMQFASAGFKASGSLQHLQWIQILRSLKPQIHPGLKLYIHSHVKIHTMATLNNLGASLNYCTTPLYSNAYFEINVPILGILRGQRECKPQNQFVIFMLQKNIFLLQHMLVQEYYICVCIFVMFVYILRCFRHTCHTCLRTALNFKWGPSQPVRRDHVICNTRTTRTWRDCKLCPCFRWFMELL